jgi:hypothetical protein
MGVLMFFTTVARHSHDSTLQADYSPKCVERGILGSSL